MNTWFRVLPVALSFLVLSSLSIPAQSDDQTSDLPTITADEALDYVGQKVVVCGVVVEAVYLSHSQRKLTFLNFDRPHPDQSFDVVIEEADRAKFTEAPEETYLNKKVCVTGVVNEFKSKAQITVTDPGQLSVEEDESKENAAEPVETP